MQVRRKVITFIDFSDSKIVKIYLTANLILILVLSSVKLYYSNAYINIACNICRVGRHSLYFEWLSLTITIVISSSFLSPYRHDC